MNKIKNISLIAILCMVAIAFSSCKKDKDDDNTDPAGPNFSGTYSQQDQMGRPAINTVFVGSSDKDDFNRTVPSAQSAKYQAKFEAALTGLSPAYANMGDENALGQDAATFTGLLATDVLNVSLDGTTTFFDGTNVLTGRALADDAITVELILIFGGETGLTASENPTLSDDNVSQNDKAFLTSFPYVAAPW